ncbi:PepSY domain-containing protein [Caulobacter mirabilis]|uniref:Peptidase n=1 Tax=Caulobacter mirabilis TaxID=69666 RepID=A0A2D2B0B5_9CAUL|nr:PepSY domain-containing protein [Caulobacter mirabilis]ATQ43700.1 peptidase [Caulobacter mirabilis]
MFLIRTLHKWFGLILGLQFLLWSISGAMMALIPHSKIESEHTIREPAVMVAPEQALPLAAAERAFGAPVTGLKLRPLGEGFVYEAATPAGTKLIDAVSGAPVIIDAARASALAAAAYSGDARIVSVRKVAEASVETRRVPLPVWRVEFDDREHTTVMVSATTGKEEARRNDSWRLWDIFWMIHIMDYTDRDNFNHPLIITVATGVTWLALSGLILLFRAFRRSDVSWVLDPIERMRDARKSRAG